MAEGDAKIVTGICASLAPYPPAMLPWGLCDEWATRALCTADPLDIKFALFLASVVKRTKPVFIGPIDAAVRANAVEEDGLEMYSRKLMWGFGACPDTNPPRDCLTLALQDSGGGSWVPPSMAGAGTKKAVLFLIDRTFDPILKPAIDAVKDIFHNTCSVGDKIALSDLDPSSWQIPLTVKKAGNEASLLQRIENENKMGGGARCVIIIAEMLSRQGKY